MHPHHSRHHTPFVGSLPKITIDENTPPQYRVFHAMRSVMHAQKQLMMRRLAEKDAHLAQAFSLWVLSANEGLSQAELADVLMVARPTVTVMLGKMERAGLIERRADQTDQRNKRIYLTDDGRALHAQLRAVHEEIVEITCGSLSAEEMAELERLLRVVENNLTEEGPAE